MSDDRATNRLSRRKNSGSWLVGVCTAGSPRPGRGVAPLFGSRGAVHATSRASTFCSPAAGGPARRRPRGVPRTRPAARARDAAIFLLHTAAEIEHALLVQYLYAAYSLGDPKDKTLRAWQDSIVTIAKQEMSHLMTVQGLLRFLGGPPNFMREDPPFDSDFYPFPFQLLPISRQSLAYYVAAECPDFASLPKDVTDLLPQTMGQIRINRVGILYAKLISIFTERPKPDDKELHLEDTDFLTNVGSYQPPKDDWSKNIDNPTLPDPLPSPMTGKQIRARGLQVLRAIKEQGESGSDANSHFERYLAIFTAFPKGPGPADDVATNPNTSLPRTPRDPTESELAKGRITNEVSRLWAQFFNARYRLLLMRLSHFLVLEDSTDMGKKDRRAFLQTTCLSEMPNHLGPLATQLVTLPLTDHPACKSKAGAPFELPYTLNIPDREQDRWRLHRDVVVLSTNVYNALVQKDPSLVNDPLVKDIHRSDLDDLTFIEQAINATS